MTLYSLCKEYGIKYQTIYGNRKRERILCVKLYGNTLFADDKRFERLSKIMQNCDMRTAFNKLEYELQKEINK